MIAAFRARRILLWSSFALASCFALPEADAAADLKWDLSYQAALRKHPMRNNELLRVLLKRYPKRPMHERLADYSGEPIEASVLLEGGLDIDAKGPPAIWITKTRTTARLCSVTGEKGDDCQALDPARTDTFIREMMHFAPLHPVPTGQHALGEDKGTPILMNYFYMLSVYVDGRVMQRPVATLEMGMTGLVARDKDHPHAGRVLHAIERLMLLDKESRQREADAAESGRP